MVFDPRDRDVLVERARRLARPVAAINERRVEMVEFDVADETYAIESRRVLAVFTLRDLTPLPGADPMVAGIMAWRGELLTILDLRRALGISASGLDNANEVIVLGDHRPSFGLLASAVRLKNREEGSGKWEEGRNSPCVRGVAPDAVVILDGDALLRLAEQDEAGASGNS